MIKKSLFFSLFLYSLALGAQAAISGQINMDLDNNPSKVHLTKLDLDHIRDLKFAKPVAWTPVGEDGSFSFDQKHIADKDAVYHIYVKRVEEALNDTIAAGTTFILSKVDKLNFNKTEIPFATYTTSNQADKEWKRLLAHEAELLRLQLDQDVEEKRLKGYAKDSLRILMVKLIGIKQLEEKGLLEQDITKNSEFYLALLSELKESQMPRENYLFLEKRLAFLTQGAIEKKYAWSKTANYILGILVLALFVYTVFRRRSAPMPVALSRQEQNIQKLIVEGKTNKEIANELYISISTVKTHITNIYQKLKVANRQELVRKMRN